MAALMVSLFVAIWWVFCTDPFLSVTESNVPERPQGQGWEGRYVNPLGAKSELELISSR